MGSNWPLEKNLIKTKGTMKNKKPNIAAVYTLLLEITAKGIFVSI